MTISGLSTGRDAPYCPVCISDVDADDLIPRVGSRVVNGLIDNRTGATAAEMPFGRADVERRGVVLARRSVRGPHVD